MARKPKIAKINYVRAIKTGVSIGIKGTEIKRYTDKEILAAIRKVNKKSMDLAEKYTKNFHFPIDEFGYSRTGNELTRWVTETMSDIKNNISRPSPARLEKEIANLLKMANKDSTFQSAFYRYVREYYGVPQYSLKKVKTELEKGSFKYIPKQKTGGFSMNTKGSDPVPLQNWLIGNVDNIDEDKIMQITDLYELRRLAQSYEQTGYVDDDLYLFDKDETQ